MSLYLISFNWGDMQVDEADMPAVADAAHAVIREARAAGVLVFAGGAGDPRATTVVGRDGAATPGPGPGRSQFIAGLTVVDVPHRDDALLWAGRIAASCRCAQEVREFLPGSER